MRTCLTIGALPALLLCSACATGLPVGARASLTPFEPFSRPASQVEVPEPPEETPRPLVVAPGAREDVVTTARGLVGRQRVEVGAQRFGDDCTGLVRAVYARVGVDLMGAARPGDNGVTAIWRFAAAHGRLYEGGRPVGGDLVFFRDTYDLNRDDRANDGLTHIGLIEDVEADGTVIVIHRVARGVVRYRMNLEHRDSHLGQSGRPVNDWLRTPSPGAAPQLTAQLFAGYATLLPVESRLAGR